MLLSTSSNTKPMPGLTNQELSTHSSVLIFILRIIQGFSIQL